MKSLAKIIVTAGLSLMALSVYANPFELSLTNWSVCREGDSLWISAPVPGTVAAAYRNAGLMEDITFDDNLTRIDDGWYNADFRYKTTFVAPASLSDYLPVLDFDGVNWKAEVWLNGQPVGNIDGAFIRSHFDVSAQLQLGAENVLEVLVHHPAHPGAVKIPTLLQNVGNGGELGADNPTFHASIGWDWIPTVPGRNMGIWNDVRLRYLKGGVSVEDVFFPSKVSGGKAVVSPEITLRNFTSKPVKATLEVNFGPVFKRCEVEIPSGVSDIPVDDLIIDSPELWWPAGYGGQHLYEAAAELLLDGYSTSRKTVKCGIRQMEYRIVDNGLQFYVNGRRFIPFGGNWGFSDLNLESDARRYDIALAYHKLMNFNMVRNWVGQIGDDEFYEACDRNGIMVWQDFWLANPSDGPDPDDNDMFMANAGDMVRRIRHHSSIALWCGRNEGNPPLKLDRELNALVAEKCPGSIYIPNSAEYWVSGRGPYCAMSPVEYYRLQKGRKTFHTERGTICIPEYESMYRMFKPEHRWPQNDVWAMHNFTLAGAQKATAYNELVSKGFDDPWNLKEFCRASQFINYSTYRAMFESRSANRNGLLLWMSHPAWPCLAFQTYDWWFAPNASVSACRKACAPIHISWNPMDRSVEVVNISAGNKKGLTVEVSILNMDGTIVHKDTYTTDSEEDSTRKICTLEPNDLETSDVYFISLKLKKGNDLLADNFYWEGREEGNWKALKSLPEVDFKIRMKTVPAPADAPTVEGKTPYYKLATIRNAGKTPAVLIRLKLVNADNGEEVLPVFYEDNYFSLMPGEKKTVLIGWLPSVSGNEDIPESGVGLVATSAYPCPPGLR